jgi:hypothetical protein
MLNSTYLKLGEKIGATYFKAFYGEIQRSIDEEQEFCFMIDRRYQAIANCINCDNLGYTLLPGTIMLDPVSGRNYEYLENDIAGKGGIIPLDSSSFGMTGLLKLIIREVPFDISKLH